MIMGGLEMTFWQVLTVTGVCATILGVFLTIYALINNRTLKEESRLTRETIKETIKETHEATLKVLKYIADLIVSEGEKTRQAIKT